MQEFETSVNKVYHSRVHLENGHEYKKFLPYHRLTLMDNGFINEKKEKELKRMEFHQFQFQNFFDLMNNLVQYLLLIRLLLSLLVL